MFTRPIHGPRGNPVPMWSHDNPGEAGIDLRDDLPTNTPTMSAPPPHVVYDPTSPTGTWELPGRSGFYPPLPNPFAPRKANR